MTPPDTLRDLLLAVQQALDSGDRAALATAAEAIQAALDAGVARPDAAAAAALRKIAERNAARLEATARGLRVAGPGMAEIRTARTGGATYNGQGQRVALGGADLALRARV